jgi:hypothetical protein
MIGITRWSVATLAGVGALASRALWLAWQYYFNGGPRYRVESAMIALVIAGIIVVVMRRGDRPGDESPPASLQIAWLPVLIVAAVALYAQAIGLGFLSDDYTLRAMAQSSSLGSGIGWFFRPLPLLVWRGLLAIVDAPAVLHLLNVLLHGLNAYLVGVLGTLIGMRRSQALGAAFMFLAFPALPEAVAWTAGIQDVLMTTMALAAVVVSARESPSGRRIAVVCVLLLLGLGSKETAICIPGLIALCWLTPARLRRDARLYVAIVLVTVAYLAVRLPMGISSEYFGAPSRYFFKQLIVVAFGTLAAPWRAPASAFDRALAFAAVGVLVLLLVHAFLFWRREESQPRRDARLALWILASIAPVFTLFFVGETLEGSRYLYLAAAAWALLVADLIASITDRVSRRSLTFGVAIAGVVLVFVLSLQRELVVWRRAADLRDRVLSEAQVTLGASSCDRPTFANVPDSVDGAYVFRNGFPEAVGLAAADPSRRAEECRFAWTGGGFVRVP